MNGVLFLIFTIILLYLLHLFCSVPIVLFHEIIFLYIIRIRKIPSEYQKNYELCNLKADTPCHFACGLYTYQFIRHIKHLESIIIK